MDIEYVRSRFIKHFDGTTGSVYASPGRINLIGEHTDYNGGFVFPGAVDKGMIAEIKPNGTDKVRAYSIDLKDYVEFGLNEEDAPKASWARYIFGVCREMIKRGVDVKGFDTAFAGDVPLGAGMSSSAALESTYAFAINELFGDNKIDKFELAKVGQATEHNYCGVNCGIMDQFASVFGKEGSLIRLDCRSLEYQYFPFKPEGYRLVLVDGHDDGRNVKTGADELPFIVEQGGIAFLFPIERAYAFSPQLYIYYQIIHGYLVLNGVHGSVSSLAVS